MPNTTLIANVTSSIGNAFVNTIGTGGAIGLTLVGIFVLILFLYWIWSAGLGVYGMVVIIPALLGLLAVSGWLPSWLDVVIWIIVGSVWALILLRFFREG